MRSVTIGAAAAVFLFAATAAAQEHPTAPVGQMEPFHLDSGLISNQGVAAGVGFKDQIHVENAAWLRVYFGKTDLGPGSFVRLTSALDGEVQDLDAATLAMWTNTSAYFNGDTLNIELVAGPKTINNRVVVEQVAVEMHAPQPVGGGGQCGICGATDDRVPVNPDDLWTGRFFPAGCTASIYNTDSCMVSAGHCVGGSMVVQFNVPNSTAGCATINPPVADQFPVFSVAATNGGVGNDWSVLNCGLNSQGLTAYQKYGQLRPIAVTVAPNGATVSVTGYGVDLTCVLTQTQQFHSGPINAVNATFYTYSVDIRGGNSGSALIRDGEIIGIVTHCPCPNIATRVDLPAFVAGRGLCPPPAPTPIATGPSNAVDGYLRVSADEYGSWGQFAAGSPLGDSYNPVGALGLQPVGFTDGLYLFMGAQRELLTTSGDWLGAVPDDASLTKTITTDNSASDTNGDAVNDTVTSEFNVTGGAVNLSFDLTQHVENTTVAATVAVLTQTYTITNNSAAAISFDLVRSMDADLVWSGDFTNDSVGTGTNGSPLERHVYQQEAGNAATAITLSSPTGDAYVGAKNTIDPDGPGGSPAYGFGTDVQIWEAFGIPTGWRNHVANVGYNLNGNSGAAPAEDGHVHLEIPVSLAAGPGTSTTVTVRHTYGATTPAAPAAPCPWDCADGNGVVDTVDFLALLAGWGAGGPCDFDGGGVSTTDFLALLAEWGACP